MLVCCRYGLSYHSELRHVDNDSYPSHDPSHESNHLDEDLMTTTPQLVITVFSPIRFKYLCNGRAACLVPSLHLWTSILGSTSVHVPQAELPEDEETAFVRSGKGQRGLAGKEASKNGTSVTR
jgi:hypothetical protein